ncbi:hypothetical protein VTL71DRAFT_10300 [Oculimacula yallundae]|uniref:RBR-type E3 ubiquitin transferase n=1 Tax=Oculimacula yallundae TaxID=86028 RepID=A0ABR4CUX6_9HELO
MLNADGTSTAFGLTFRAHDNRQMQHILRAYGRLPENPSARSTLYLALTGLENSLSDEEAQPIRDWLRAGGSLSDFPGPSAAQGPPIDGSNHSRPATSRDVHDDDVNYEDMLDEAGQNVVPPSGGITLAVDRASSRSNEQDEDVEVDDRASEEAEDGIDDETSVEVDDGVDDDSEDIVDEEEEEHRAVRRAANRQWNGPESEVVPGLEKGYTLKHLMENPDIEVPADWKECYICNVTYAPDKLLEGGLEITSTCKHGMKYVACLGCIRHTITYGLENGRAGKIRCPFCLEFFAHEDIMKYGTPKIITRYNHLVLMATPGLIMCLGPNCGAGQVHPTDHRENPVMTCNSCGFLTCVVHKLPWHEGFSCEEFDCDDSQIERLEAEELTAKLLSQNSKVCPTCKEGVTKSDGCDHMECRCGEAWCWECLTSWENILRIGATAHARHCTYHPDKVRIRRDQTDASARNMAELVHGGPVSEALANAREQHNTKRREKMRPLALEAAEKRAKAAKEEADKLAAENGGSPIANGAPRKKLKLIKPWEEK